MSADASAGELPLFDQLLKFLSFGIAGIALAILGMTFLLLQRAEGKDKGYQSLIRLFMKVSVVFVTFSLVISMVQLLRPEPPTFTEDVLLENQWHHHWAGGNWITSGEFYRKDDGVHFRATTYEVMDGDMKGREILKWWSNGPVKISAKRIGFEGVRHDLVENAKMPTKFELQPGLSAIGGFSGINEEGFPNKLRFYSASDNTIKVVKHLDYCKVARSTGACPSNDAK
jgi:hypothetical protein